MLTALAARLTDLGYAQRDKGLFTKVISDEPVVLGWIGLNTGKRKRGGALDVNPVIGIRHQEVEHKLADLRGEDAHDYEPPTVSVPLGYLMPNGTHRLWRFEDEAEVEAIASDLVEAVQSYGEKAMADNVDLTTLAETIEEFGFVPSRSYRLPLVLHMLGRNDEARNVVLNDLPMFGDTRNDARLAYEEFAPKMFELTD